MYWSRGHETGVANTSGMGIVRKSFNMQQYSYAGKHGKVEHGRWGCVFSVISSENRRRSDVVVGGSWRGRWKWSIRSRASLFLSLATL